MICVIGVVVVLLVAPVFWLLVSFVGLVVLEFALVLSLLSASLSLDLFFSVAICLSSFSFSAHSASTPLPLPRNFGTPFCTTIICLFVSLCSSFVDLFNFANKLFSIKFVFCCNNSTV